MKNAIFEIFVLNVPRELEVPEGGIADSRHRDVMRLAPVFHGAGWYRDVRALVEEDGDGFVRAAAGADQRRPRGQDRGEGRQ